MSFLRSLFLSFAFGVSGLVGCASNPGDEAGSSAAAETIGGEAAEPEAPIAPTHITQVATMMRLATIACWSNDPEAMRGYWADQGYELVASVHDEGAFVYDLIKNAKSLVVVFRGSQSKDQWFSDFDFQTMQPAGDYSEEFIAAGVGARYHSGFYKNVQAGAPKLIKLIDAQQKISDVPLYITGHSLGAAHAQLFGWLLYRHTMMPEAVYSFASPKVGNQVVVDAFDREFEGSFLRYYDGDDPVPASPSSVLYPFYARSAREVNLFDKQLVVNGDGTINPTGLTGAAIPIDAFAHLPQHYLQRLDSLDTRWKDLKAKRERAK